MTPYPRKALLPATHPEGKKIIQIKNRLMNRSRPKRSGNKKRSLNTKKQEKFGAPRKTKPY
jgi:hypothetical protein